MGVGGCNEPLEADEGPLVGLVKLEREEPLGRGEGQGLIDTLWINLWSTCVPPVKIASGGRATARPRSLEKSPRELKTQEGIAGHTADSDRDEHPEDDATSAGAGQPAG
jgi:hypothetical protein